MNFIIERNVFTKDATLGNLYINNKFFCYSLEDAVRGLGIKIPGYTAIPEGIYEVILSYSPKFKRITPELKNVLNFKDIRLHGGNVSTDTKGCPLVAYKKINDYTIQGSAERDITSLLQKETGKSYIKIFNNINPKVLK